MDGGAFQQGGPLHNRGNDQPFSPQVNFAAVVGAKDACPRSPIPGGPANSSGPRPGNGARCIFLGDTSVDMKTAVGAGRLPWWGALGLPREDELLTLRGQVAACPQALGSGRTAELISKPVAEEPPGDDHGTTPITAHRPVKGQQQRHLRPFQEHRPQRLPGNSAWG